MNICKHDEFCGGCIYQQHAYEEQLKIKENEVLALLEKKDVQPEFVDKIEGWLSGIIASLPEFLEKSLTESSEKFF